MQLVDVQATCQQHDAGLQLRQFRESANHKLRDNNWRSKWNQVYWLVDNSSSIGVYLFASKRKRWYLA